MGLLPTRFIVTFYIVVILSGYGGLTIWKELLSLSHVTVSSKLSWMRFGYADATPSAELSGNRLP